MKNFENLTHYALLELQTNASTSQIKAAYESVKKTYGNDSMATYSLLDYSSRKEVLKKIEEAYYVLCSEMRRKEYDLEIGIQGTKGETAKSELKPFRSERGEPSGKAKVPQKSSSGNRASLQKGIPDLSEQEIKGSLFQEIREKQGIPLQEIAEETRINITYLQYIESDRYKSLPAEVYLKGYLEQYTKFLGLDPAQVVEKFLERFRAAQ